MSALARVARKVKRNGKSAYQFRCTSTFEYIELECKGTWRPDQLRVLWQRSNRKVTTVPVRWEAIEDRGPQGATGKAVFETKLEVALIITLYQEAKQMNYDSKEYNYYIENVGPKGVKQLALFTCNIAEYVGVGTRYELDFVCQPVSVKVSKALLGLTLEAQLIKKGSPDDADMQSTFSSVSAGEDQAMAVDEEEESSMQLAPMEMPSPVNQTSATPVSGVLSLAEPAGKSAPAMKEEVGVRSGPMVKEEVGVRSGPMVKEEVGVRSGPMVKEEVGVRSGPMVKEEVGVRSGPMVKEEVGVRSGSMVKEEAGVRSGPMVKEEVGVRSGSMMKEVQEMKRASIVSTKEDLIMKKDVKTGGEKEPPAESIANAAEMPIASFFSGTELLDSTGTPVLQKLVKSQLIALYFACVRCPPCQSFLPYLTKFYGHLMDLEKPFEVLYILCDDSESYQKVVQSAPYPVVNHNHPAAERLKKQFGVDTVPAVVIVTPSGKRVEMSAVKLIKAATGSGSGSLKLFSRWAEIAQSTSPRSESISDGGTTIILDDVTVDSRSQQNRASQKSSREVPQQPPQDLELQRRLAAAEAENVRLQSELERLRLEVRELTHRLETYSRKEQELAGHREMSGCLYKRGIKGPTARVWRRRYFKIENHGTRMVYYKNPGYTLQQGHIEIDKITGVMEVNGAQQDKNHATFQVQCEGRIYQLQAQSEIEMKRWLNALQALCEARRSEED
ncbi:hypothetical protein EMCRGX_G022478 [Ephydatia muelleri]